MPCELIKGQVSPWLINLQWLPIVCGKQKTLWSTSAIFPSHSSHHALREPCSSTRERTMALQVPGLTFLWTVLLPFSSRHYPGPTSSLRLCLTIPL